MKEPAEAKAAVDAAIVEKVLPKAYSLIDQLMGQLGKEAPKSLVIEVGRFLPSQYKHSFSKAKK